MILAELITLKTKSDVQDARFEAIEKENVAQGVRLETVEQENVMTTTKCIQYLAEYTGSEGGVEFTIYQLPYVTNTDYITEDSHAMPWYIGQCTRAGLRPLSGCDDNPGALASEAFNAAYPGANFVDVPWAHGCNDMCQITSNTNWMDIVMGSTKPDSYGGTGLCGTNPGCCSGNINFQPSSNGYQAGHRVAAICGQLMDSGPTARCV